MILVVASHAKDRLSKATYEMVSAARQVGSEDPIAILVLGSGVDAVASEATRLAEQVLVADQPGLAHFDPEFWSEAVASIAREGEARLILIAGNRDGRGYSPRVAVRLDAPLLEDVISLASAGGVFTAQRPSYLARATETLEAESTLVVVTVKQGEFAPAAALDAAGEQVEVALTVKPGRVQ